jgi:hypothetical protein
MAEAAAEVLSSAKKRWRAWLRAIHRDVGYLAVGFTIIYAISGIAMNHIDSWDPSFRAESRTLSITPVADELDDDEAAAYVSKAAGLEAPSTVYRAGDEVRLEYENGTKVTAIGEQVTVQARSDRFFFRAAVWLHATRGKTAWKYISDIYAILLLYLAFSGLLMIKGRLGFKWRGSILVATGIAVPVMYIVLSGGPSAKSDKPPEAMPESGMRALPPEPE